jgi:hypothetical protein
MMAAELDRSRRDGVGLAYLFSDIRPEFYSTFGFRTLPSRTLTLRADALPARRVHPTQVQAGDWPAIRRCFDAYETRRAAGFLRDASVWSWIRMRMRHGSESAGPQFDFVLRRNRGVRAYVFGSRIPERDTYWVEEFGFVDDASAEMIPALLRAAAGDLRRVSCWVPPDAFRGLLPKGTARKRSRSILMLAPLRAEGQRLLDSVNEKGDFCWATDHI